MKVFVTRRLPQKGYDLLEQAGLTVRQHTERRELGTEELIAACRDCDALLSIGLNPLDRAFIEAAPQLKGIALMSAGYDNIDLAAATRLGIPVSNTPGVLSTATANVAFLLIQSVARNAFQAYNRIRNGEWGFFEPTANLGMDIEGRTLGILGLGKIGMELAAKCRAAFGMKVIYHNRGRNPEAEAQLGAQYVSFEALLAQSDILSVHASLSESTKGIFNRAAFEQMKRTAIFINTARGGIHNEPELTEALQQELIWGAGLDVTNPEPMDRNNPLLTMPRVCVLPHIGSATAETRDNMALTAAGNVIAALQGRPMPQCLNPEVYD